MSAIPLPPPAILIGGNHYRVLEGLLLPTWSAAAMSHGFELLERIRDKRDGDRIALAARCTTCTSVRTVWLDDVLTGQLTCPACRTARIGSAAAALGARILAQDPRDDKTAQVALACGHVHHLSHARLIDAASGGPAISCAPCREDGYAAIALTRDRELVGPASDGDPDRRQYRHSCGHVQDAEPHKVYHRWAPCAVCNDPPSERSTLYLARVGLESGPVLKLGVSGCSRARIRSLAAGVDKTRLRVVRMPSKALAHHEETLCHRILHAEHAELCPPLERVQAVDGPTEVYEVRAEPLIQAMLDAIEARYSRYDGRHGEIAPGG